MSQKVRSKYGIDSKPRFYMKIIFFFKESQNNTSIKTSKQYGDLFFPVRNFLIS